MAIKNVEAFEMKVQNVLKNNECHSEPETHCLQNVSENENILKSEIQKSQEQYCTCCIIAIQNWLPVIQHVLVLHSQDCRDIATGRALQHFIISSGLESSPVLVTQLIRIFTVCRHLYEAEKVFWRFPGDNVFIYTEMMAAYNGLGHAQATIQLHSYMQEKSIAHDGHSFVAVIKACNIHRSYLQGKIIHSHVVEDGFELNPFVQNALIDLYAKSGRVEESVRLFHSFPNKDITTWNAMITGFFQCGYSPNAVKLFGKLQNELSVMPNMVTWNAVVAGCAQSGLFNDALNFFYRMEQEGLQPNKLTWNSLIGGCAEHGRGDEGLQLFWQMQIEGIETDVVTFMNVLKACYIMGSICQGRFLHGQIIELGYESNKRIQSILVDMYAKSGDLQAAGRVFHGLAERDTVLWNNIIAAHENKGDTETVFQLFQQMQEQAMEPHQVTFVLLLKACIKKGYFYDGKLLHNYVYEICFDHDLYVGTAIIDLYMKCGFVEDARLVFDKMPSRGVVTWSALIAGYSWHGHAEEALHLLQQMHEDDTKPNIVTWNGLIRGCAYNGLCTEAFKFFQDMFLEDFEPNEATIVALVTACSGRSDMIAGEVMHSYIIEGGWDKSSGIGTALINMYGKSGSLEASTSVFHNLSKQEAQEWSVIIEAFAHHGQYPDTAKLFQGMTQQEGLIPNEVILASILKSCTNNLMLYQSKIIHLLAIELGFGSKLIVGNCLINVYTKCGSINDAWIVFHKLPVRDEVTWSALIEGYVEHSDHKSAMRCFESMNGDNVDPNDVTFLSLLSTYSHAGLVNEACQFFNQMMSNYSINLTFNHYSCMVDLLGRAGRLTEADDLLKSMPYRPNFLGYLSLLNHCKNHGHSGIGDHYFENSYHLTCRHSASYDFMLEIHAHSDSRMDLQVMRKCANAWKKPAEAHVQFNNNVELFMVGDKVHTEVSIALNKLTKRLGEEGYIPCVDIVSRAES